MLAQLTTYKPLQIISVYKFFLYPAFSGNTLPHKYFFHITKEWAYVLQHVSFCCISSLLRVSWPLQCCTRRRGHAAHTHQRSFRKTPGARSSSCSSSGHSHLVIFWAFCADASVPAADSFLLYPCSSFWARNQNAEFL